MELDWGDADPNYFLGRLMGLTVAINGGDCSVVMVSRDGVTVRGWSEDLDAAVGGERRLDWDEVETLFVY